MLRRLVKSIYGLLLAAFPRRHRDRYGDEMLHVFAREFSVRRDRGGLRRALPFAAASLADVVVAGLRERRRASGHTGAAGPGEVFRGAGKDLILAARGLARSWMFTLVSLFSLAAGLGVTMAIDTLIRVTLDPPFELDEEGLVEILPIDEAGRRSAWSWPDLEDLRRADAPIDLVAWTTGVGTIRTPDGGPGERADVAYVSPGYFDVLGIRPVRGRGLSVGEASTGGVPVVLRHRTWQDRFDGDPDIVGRAIVLNRIPHVVVGVAPPRFPFHLTTFQADLWVPLESHPDLADGAPRRYDREAAFLGVLGRVRAGGSVEGVDASIRSVMAGVADQYPATNAGISAGAYSYEWQGAEVVADDVWLLRTLFWGTAGTVLLVVCMNLAGMFMVRSASRERELAVRLAVGSSRGRLVRYLMAEAVVIAAVGGVLVTAVLWAALRTLSWRFAFPLPESIEVGLGTLGLCLGLSLAATLVFGLGPALKFSRPKLLAALKDDGGTGGRRSGRLHRLAAAVQTGLAVPVLVVAAGVAQGFVSLDGADFGFPAEELVVWSPMDLAVDGYDEAAAHAFGHSLAERVRGLPGVEAVALADGVPLDGYSRSARVSSPDQGTSATARVTRVEPLYLETLGVPLVRGRGIEAADREGATPVAVVTRTLAESLFPGSLPLGRRIDLESDGEVRRYTVIGVSGDVAGAHLESSADNVFVPLAQEPTTILAMVVRGSSPGQDVATAIRDAALEIDPDLARPLVQPFDGVVRASSQDFGFFSLFFGLLATLLLFLTALGIYGVVAFSVAGRTREIGVRMSLGSSKAGVLGTVLRDAVKLALPGLVLGGLAGAAVAEGVLNGMYADIGLPMADLGVLVFAASAALGVVLVASLSPARRAASVDPAEALRAD